MTQTSVYSAASSFAMPTWPTSFDQLWQSPAFPMWVTLAAGVFFALVLLITLFRAEKSVANGALTVITLLAIGVAVAATMRNFGESRGFAPDSRTPQPTMFLAALSCLDGLAGEVVEVACEKSLFASAESAAAGVSYTAAQLTRLSAFGDEATSNNNMTPELSALRRAVERDRYGLAAHVLNVRDGCTPSDCAFYKFLSDHNQIAANMTDRTYQGLIARYSTGWNAPGPAATATGTLPSSVPSGKPMSGDFPSSSSIPAVSIMTPEPTAPPAAAAPKPPTSPPATAQTAPPRLAVAPTAPKKQPPKKNTVAPSATPSTAPAPLPLAPPQQSDDN